MKWYVIQVATGTEIAVRDELQRLGIPAKVPQEERPIRKGGQWVGKLYVLMPNYVFLGAEEFGAHEYYTARKAPGFVHFLGQPPQPISHIEAEWVNLIAPGNEPLQPSLVRETEQGTEVVAGVLAAIPGRQIKMDTRRKRARFELSLLGETREVEFSILLEGAEDEGRTGQESP